MVSGKQVRLFLADGTVGGLITAEILNWTGHVLRGRRSDLSIIKKRDEAAKTGVYLLFGTDDEGDMTAYIGESDNVAKRLESHHNTKDFWQDVVIITSKDMNLTKAHVRFLEAELIRTAKEIGRVDLANDSAPTGGAALPEADESDMRYFIEQVRILMPVLGFDIFRGRTSNSPSAVEAPQVESPLQNPVTAPSVASTETTEEPTAPSGSPTFILRSRTGVDAQAQIIDGEFTVLAGSKFRAQLKLKSGSSAATQRQLDRNAVQHAKLMERAILTANPAIAELQKDKVFSSPSSAAAVCLGRASANGRTEWKTAEGQTYESWEL